VQVQVQVQVDVEAHQQARGGREALAFQGIGKPKLLKKNQSCF